TGSAFTSTPPTTTRPASGRSTPVSSRIVVVFPAPLGPTYPATVPRSTSNETSWRISFPSRATRTCWTRIMGIAEWGLRIADRSLKSAIRSPRSAMTSSRRPGEGAAAEEVEVDVEDGLLRAGAVVHDEAVVREPLLRRHLPGGREEVAHERLVLFLDGVGARDRLARDDEDVDGRGRLDVPEGDAAVVLVDDVAGDLAVGDLLEEGLLGHGGRGRDGHRRGRAAAKLRPARPEALGTAPAGRGFRRWRNVDLRTDPQSAIPTPQSNDAHRLRHAQ